MPQILTLNLSGVRKKVQFFQEMADRLRDLRPVWDQAHHYFIHDMIQQFMTQGEHLLAQPWQPLSPRYLAYKIRHFGVPPSPFGILYREGRLFEAMTNEGSPFHVYATYPDGAAMGARVFYGPFHQRGAGRLPKRKIVHLTGRFRRFVFRATVAYVTRGYNYLERGGGSADGVA